MKLRSSSGRFVTGAAAVLLVSAALACGDSRPEEAGGGPGNQPQKARIDTAEVATGAGTVPADPVVGDVVPVGRAGGSVAVLAVEPDVNAGRLFNAGKGRQFFAAHVKGCSGPNEKDLGFEPEYFLLETTGNVHNAGLPVKKPDLRGGLVPAGGCLEGWITYTIADDAEPVSLLYDGSSRIRWRIPTPGGKDGEATGGSPGTGR